MNQKSCEIERLFGPLLLMNVSEIISDTVLHEVMNTLFNLQQ